MSELKPCPFCGGNNCGVRAGTDEIWCVCGGHSPHGWNSRPIENKLQAEIERLQKRVDELEVQLKSKDIIINNQQGRLNYYATKDLLGEKK